MADLDTRYVLAYHFEQYFVDKDTGVPLTGQVSFFRDSSRLVPKDVFILSGSPGNYTYTNIGSVVDIANGVPTYNNDNIAIYFLPYIVTAGVITTTLDLYFYSVENSDAVLQFTREAQPNLEGGSAEQIVDLNYIPNGQFFLHNNIPETFIDPIYAEGQIRAAITEVAAGGWTFERDNALTPTEDFVTFDQQLPTTPSIDQNPRYVIHLITDTDGDAKKDLCVKFNDVNKFASTTEQYTFSFTGKNQSGSSSVDLVLIKNYGTGGSTRTEQTLTTFSITSSYTQFQFSFVFGDNSAKTIGTLNDDYVQLALRHTDDSAYNIFYADFLLTLGAITTPAFPPTPNNDFMFRSLAGHLRSSRSPYPIYPDYDGWDLYLPIRLTQNGFNFDDSEVGDVHSETQTGVYVDGLHPTTNRIHAAGWQFETAGYSPLGIPFARLQSKYWISSINMPRYGTGSNYFCATLPTAANIILINNNSAGAVTNIADGTAATGFTFATIHKPTASYFVKSALVVTTNTFFIKNNNPGAVDPILAGTSGFTVATVREGTSLISEISEVITATIANNPGNPGKYFQIQSYNGGGVDFYIWYQVSTETDPAPGGTAIKINIAIGETAVIIAQKTWQALNGWQESLVTTNAASTLTAGDFFTLASSGTVPENYYVWYRIDGAGTDPAPVGRIGILVDVLSTDTANMVASKTQEAINMKYFAVPDLRGYFLRGFDDGAGVDPGNRWSLVPGVAGDVLGTFELDEIVEHNHTVDVTGGAAQIVENAGAVNVALYDPHTQPTSLYGFVETRPVNANVNYSIIY